VKAIRRGKPIPTGYVLTGQTVTIKRGNLPAGATLLFKCPGDKRLKTFATTGQAGFVARQNYANHRQTCLESFMTRDAIGTAYDDGASSAVVHPVVDQPALCIGKVRRTAASIGASAGNPALDGQPRSVVSRPATC
jgi:hypothetical protein